MNTLDSVTSAVTAAASPAVAGSAFKEQEDRFLQLLVTQLKNQDPLNPLDNAQVTSQMAQISTVQGLEKLNATLAQLLSSFNAGQQLAAADLVGRGVLTPGDTLALQSGAAVFGVNLAAPADAVTVTMFDGSGRAVHSEDLGALGTGAHAFQWDGVADNGSVLAEGGYRFEVRANAAGTDVSAAALAFGRVDAVSRSGETVMLQLGGGRSAPFTDVIQVF